MTFTVTLINQHGVWQSADLRLTDPRNGACMDDYSVKHVGFECPDGSALLTYSGMGRVGDVHISDWIRQFIRGESYSVDNTLVRIRKRATEDLGHIVQDKFHHMFSVGAFLGDAPWLVQIRNFSVTRENGIGPPMCKFQTVAQQVQKGVGAGCSLAVVVIEQRSVGVAKGSHETSSKTKGILRPTGSN